MYIRAMAHIPIENVQDAALLMSRKIIVTGKRFSDEEANYVDCIATRKK